MCGLRTIVSITPIRVQADSRSFKIAASIARFGYTSILVEGQRSDLDPAHLPFQLVSIERLSRASNTTLSQSPTKPSRAAREAFRSAREALPQLFMPWYFCRHAILPLRHIPKASLYYLHDFTLFPAVYLLSNRCKVPIIYDAHDFYSGQYSATEIDSHSFGRRWITTFYRYLESRLIKKASAVVTVSSGVARLLHETFGCNPIVLRNCHDLRLDEEPSTDLRQALGLSPDHFILVAVGNAKQGATIPEALDAMRELPARVHLVFLGKSFEPHMKSIYSRHLEGRVHVVPPVKPFEVVPFIRSADASIILYYPRSADYRNSLPNRFFQPLAAQLPLLYPELPEIKRIAEKHEIGIPIDPQFPKSITNAVMKLLDDPSLVARYRRNLRVARHELSWEREEAILRNLISATLAQDDFQ